MLIVKSYTTFIYSTCHYKVSRVIAEGGRMVIFPVVDVIRSLTRIRDSLIFYFYIPTGCVVCSIVYVMGE